MHFVPTPGQCVLDIGANDGTYAERYAQQVTETGWVWAVEPNPVAVNLARTRCKRYPWVIVMQAAIGATPGQQTFHVDANDSRHSSLYRENLIGGAIDIETQVTTLDTVVAAMLRYPHWIKIDAQGAEGAILQGATKTLDERRASWCVELWHHGLLTAGSSCYDVIEQFQSRGYTALLGKERVSWADVRTRSVSKRAHGSIDVVCLPPQSSEP